jgi:hypothetical protein
MPDLSLSPDFAADESQGVGSSQPFSSGHLAEFYSGTQPLSNAGRQNASSFSDDSARWNASVDAMLNRPTSVFSQLMPSGNGMSATDASHRTISGEFYGNGNGETPGTLGTETDLAILNGDE